MTEENLSKGVSIIIPITGYTEYTDKCVESALQQDISKEIILVGSENDLNKLKNTYSDYKDIRYVITSKNDAGSKRNLGIYASTKQYISFIDDDDEYYSKDALSKLLNVMSNNTCVMAGGSIIIYDYKNKIIKEREDLVNRSFNKIINIKEYQYETGFYRFLYDKKLFEKVKFNGAVRFQDCIFIIEMLINNIDEKIVLIPDFIYKYRKRHKVENWNPEKDLAHITGVIYLINLAKEYKLDILMRRMLINLIKHKKIRNSNKNLYFKEYSKIRRRKIIELLGVLNFRIVARFNVLVIMAICSLLFS